MKKMISLLVVATLLATLLIPQGGAVYAADYNYGEALQKSIMFYEFQRSGKLPADKRDNWRGDSGLNDGKDNGVDLTGGWYDAGDHVKFNLPMSYTAAMLAWSVYENKDAYTKSGQLKYIVDDIKWADDYLMKCHTGPNEYYYQVGAGGTDHSWWGPCEVMQMDRPSYKVTASSGGSTVVAETAAALAATAAAFKSIDSAYAAKCLQHAKELYTFADTTKSDAGYTAASGFYNSWSGFVDELAWSATWIYLATNDDTYLAKAEAHAANFGTEQQSTIVAYKWAQCWDDVHYGAQLLLARITNKDVYKENTERSLDYWTTGVNGTKIKYTPKGLAWMDTWGSLRYATTMAFLADVYASSSVCTATKVDTYKSFAKAQADYALGSSGRSFEIGYGTNPPQHPHHRTAHSSWSDQQTVPANHRHVLVGALVGGPDSADGYTDEISNYTTNEVACDYNAGFTGLLGRMYDKFGGTPIANLNANEQKSMDEMFVQAAVNASGPNFVEIKALMNNRSGWPARMGDKLSFKYFVDISEYVKAGYKASDFTTSSNYNQGGAKVSELLPWDAANNIYYVNVDFTGAKIYPGGQSAYKNEIQFRIAGPLNTTLWDSKNDFSFQGIAAGSSQDLPTIKNIPVYDNGNLVFGIEAPGGPARPTPSSPVIPTPTVTPPVVPTPTMTPPVNPTPTVTSTPGQIYDNEFQVDTTFSPTRLVANQMMTAKVVTTNVSTQSYSGKKDVLLIVALYDSNNTMQNVSYISKGISYQGTETLSAGFKLPTSVTGYSVRAFVWDGTDLKDTNMMPLSNVSEVK